MYLIKSQNVADIDVAQARDGEQVAGGEDVFSADKGGDDILRGLGTDEVEGGSCGLWCDGVDGSACYESGW